MKNLYIPDAESEKVKEDFEMWEIIELLNRYKETLDLTADGQTTIEIGKKIFQSHRTVEGYIVQMMKATGAKNKTELVAIAFRLKIIE